jgi:hypothetical protein
MSEDEVRLPPAPPYPAQGDVRGWEEWWENYRQRTRDPRLADGILDDENAAPGSSEAS